MPLPFKQFVVTAPGPLMMSSREIAELTGKHHGNVMRDIRTLMQDLEQASNLNPVCASTTYAGANGQQYPQYELDRDTCMTLLLGYDAAARMRVVKRWQELEAQAFTALPDFTSPAVAARAWAEQFEQRQQLALENKAQSEALALAAPMVEFVERYVQADSGSMGLRQVCKVLGVKQPDFTAFLLARGLMYRTTPQGPLTPRAEHMHAGRFEAKAGTAEHGDSSHAYVHYKFTAKGLEWIARLWGQHKAQQLVGGEVGMTSIIKYDFEGKQQSFDADGWFNATEAATRFGRVPGAWLRLPGTISYLAAFKRKYGEITYLKTRRGVGGGTWLHPKLAVRFAQWLNDDFAVWCDGQIDAIIRNGIRVEGNADLLPLLLRQGAAVWGLRFKPGYYHALARITGTMYSGHAGGTPAQYGAITDKWVYGCLLPHDLAPVVPDTVQSLR